jgi:hypothetical protein
MADEKLAHCYPCDSNDEIARIPGRTPEAIQTRAQRLGVRKRRYFWTAREDALLMTELLRLDPRTSTIEIARRFKRGASPGSMGRKPV